MVFNGHGWASNHASRYSRPTDHQASNHWPKWFQQMYTYIYIFIQSIYIYTHHCHLVNSSRTYSVQMIYPKSRLQSLTLEKDHWELHHWVVVSNIFYVQPYLGKWSNLTSIFFGWVGSTTNQINISWISREILLTNPSAIYRLFWFQSMKEGPLVTSCLGYTGDCTKQLYGDYFINHKAPY